MAFDYLGAVQGMDLVVQDTVMDIQIGLEDGFERVLRARGKPGVLLCDRGLMDGAAYMKNEDWEKLLKKRDVQCVSELREGRYNAVFHLVTAAEGAEKFYTLENNEVRTETPELARELDHLTRNAWVGHPNLKIFDNSTDFEKKLQRVVKETARLVGLPSQLERNTIKFILKKAPDLDSFPDDVSYQIFEVEKVSHAARCVKIWNNSSKRVDIHIFVPLQVYLYDEIVNPSDRSDDITDEYSFIRKRTTLNKEGEASGSVYGLTIVQKTKDGQTIEKKRIITRREYSSLFNNRDKSRHVVRQQRISFLWNIQSFNVHVYQEPVSDVCILHAQVKSTPDTPVNEGEVEIPPFLDVDRRISNSEEDAKFGAYNISLKLD